MSPDRPVVSFPESVAVDIRRFPGVKRLAAEYTTNFPLLEPFFAGDPADETRVVYLEGFGPRWQDVDLSLLSELPLDTISPDQTGDNN